MGYVDYGKMFLKKCCVLKTELAREEYLNSFLFYPITGENILFQKGFHKEYRHVCILHLLQATQYFRAEVILTLSAPGC